MLQEFYSFLSTSTTSQLVVDRSSPNDLLKINFNIRHVLTEVTIWAKGTCPHMQARTH